MDTNVQHSENVDIHSEKNKPFQSGGYKTMATSPPVLCTRSSNFKQVATVILHKCVADTHFSQQFNRAISKLDMFYAVALINFTNEVEQARVQLRLNKTEFSAFQPTRVYFHRHHFNHYDQPCDMPAFHSVWAFVGWGFGGGGILHVYT